MAIVVYCSRCGSAFELRGMFPERCPECKKSTRWTTRYAGGAPPKVPYALTSDDVTFLRDHRIDPEPAPDQHLGATED